MEWYWIVLITILVYELIVTLFALLTNNEEATVYMAGGFVYFFLWVIFYPMGAIKRYKKSINYYKKHNISMVQFIFGKRVKPNDE